MQNIYTTKLKKNKFKTYCILNVMEYKEIIFSFPLSYLKLYSGGFLLKSITFHPAKLKSLKIISIQHDLKTK